MRRGYPLLLAVAFCAAFAQPASAQEQTPANARPRIGLVLSGGGARGAAHVGVLKVLEELRIPIDAIAGTSMGAVVGGLYASGLSAREIEREFATVDWVDAFRDKPPRLDLNFRRKQEDRDYPVQLPLGFREGSFQLPRGLIQGQKLNLILRGLTLPVSRITRFDDLPTRFRAVATDLETGEAVIMDHGDIVTALRASLSAPGIFVPVERDGHLLVDGGIAENLPVQVARDMGVDVLIVVDVGFPLALRDRLQSVASVSNQILAILVRRDSDRQRATLRPQDVLVSPSLEKMSSFDFARLPRAMAQGETAARSLSARLAQWSLPPAEYESFLAARRRTVQTPHIDFVRVDADSDKYATPVQNLFGDLKGADLDPAALQRRVTSYYGQGLLESLDYRFEAADPASPQGPAGLTFSARRNSWGPNYVRFGLRLQDDFTGNSTFDAAARVIFTELNNAGAEWIWDAQVGGNPRLASEFYLPFSEQQRWFVTTSANFQIRNVPEIVDENQVGELRVRSARVGAHLGRAIGNQSELRVGFERESGNSRVRLGDTGEAPVHFDTREYFARYSLDQLDDIAFPRRGDLLTVEWRGQLSNEFAYRVSDSLRLDWRTAHSWGRDTVVLWGTAGTLLEPQYADARSYFQLGGFLNLSGLTTNALSGPHYGIARLIYYRKVGNGGEGFLNVPLYAGFSLETGDAWQKRHQVNLASARKDASIFFGLDTFLGPAYFAIGHDNNGRTAFYLSIGRGF